MFRLSDSATAKRAGFWLGAAVLFMLLAALLDHTFRLCLAQTDGRFIYGLDDPYIHLAIAKNLAQPGVWGVTPDHTTSASSSPLWTLLLAITYKLGGTSQMVPLLLGTLATFITAFVLMIGLGRLNFRWPIAVLAAFTTVFVAPLYILPLLGMEHCLQVLLDVLFFFWAIDVSGRTPEKKDVWIAGVLAALCCACRYESAFLLVLPIGYLLYRREWRLALVLSFGCAVAIGGFGLYSATHGMPLIPNSITLKRLIPSEPMFFPDMALKALANATLRSHAYWDLICLVFALSIVVYRRKGFAASRAALTGAAITLSVVFWHSAFARVGYFFRYEAYLIVLMCTSLTLLIREFLTINWGRSDEPATLTDWVRGILVTSAVQGLLAGLLYVYRANAHLFMSLSIVLGVSLVSVMLLHCTKRQLIKTLVASSIISGLALIAIDRGVGAGDKIQSASSDIYLQQIQMSRFIDRYYRGHRVAANDIGAMTYFSDIHLLDLEGLASESVARVRLKSQLTTQTLDPIIRDFKPDLFVFYPSWFNGQTALPRWIVPVAVWKMASHTTADSETVLFAAPNKQAALVLWRQMLEFRSELPDRVALRMIAQTP